MKFVKSALLAAVAVAGASALAVEPSTDALLSMESMEVPDLVAVEETGDDKSVGEDAIPEAYVEFAAVEVPTEEPEQPEEMAQVEVSESDDKTIEEQVAEGGQSAQVVNPSSEDGDADDLELLETGVEGWILPDAAHWDVVIKNTQAAIRKFQKQLSHAKDRNTQMNLKLHINALAHNVNHYRILTRIAYYNSQKKSDVINYHNAIDYRTLLVVMAHYDININAHWRAYYDRRIRLAYATDAKHKATFQLQSQAHIFHIRNYAQLKNIKAWEYNIRVNQRLIGQDNPTYRNHYKANIQKYNFYKLAQTYYIKMWGELYAIAVNQYWIVMKPSGTAQFKKNINIHLQRYHAWYAKVKATHNQGNAVKVAVVTGTKPSFSVTNAPTLYAKNHHGAFFRWKANSKVQEYVFEIRDAARGNVVYSTTTTATAVKVPLGYFKHGTNFKVTVQHIAVIASYSSTFQKQ